MAAKNGLDLTKLMGMLECSICLERYVNPKMLKCTHEYCKLCLEGILEFHADGSATIVCPLRCELRTVIGKRETVDDLAASFIAKNVLEAVSTDEEDPPTANLPRCTLAPGCTKVVAMFCCEHLMCNPCYKRHTTEPKHKRTFRLDHDTRKNALEVTCEKHRSKCTHVCENGTFMCIYCLHRDPAHKDLCPHAKNNIDGVVRSVRHMLEKQVERMNRTEQFKTLTLEQVDSVKKSYKEEIQARKLKLLKEYAEFLNNKEESEMRNLETFCESHIQGNYGHLATPGVSACKDVFQRGIDVELLIRKRELQGAIESRDIKQTFKTLHISLGDSFGMLHSENPLGLVGVEKGEIPCNESAASTLSYQPLTVEDSPAISSNSTISESSSDGATARLDQSEQVDLKGDSCNTNVSSTQPASSPLLESSSPPVDCQKMKAQGNEYFQEGKYNEAVECYSKAISHANSNESLAIFYQNRAAANEKLGRWNEVIADCNEALIADPKYCKALLRRAGAYQSLGEKRLAAENYVLLYSVRGCTRKGCSHMNPNTNNPCSYQKLMIASVRSLCTELADKIWINRSVMLPADALVKTYFSNASRLGVVDASNLDIFMWKVDRTEDRLYSEILEKLDQGDYKNVFELCTISIDSKSKHWERASLIRGSLRYLMQDLGNADEDFNRVFNSVTTDANIQLKIYAALGLADVTGDWRFIDDAMSFNPLDAKIFYRRGRLIMRKRDPSAALDAANESVSRLEAACSDFELAIKLDPFYLAPRLSLAECHTLLANLKEDAAHSERAKTIMQETIRIFPQSSLAWFTYGCVIMSQYSSEYHTQDANEKFNKAIELDPNDPRPYEYKAMLGRDPGVNTLLACELKSTWALESVASSLLQVGRIEECLDTLKILLDVVWRKEEMINVLCLLEDIDLQTKFGYLRNKTEKQYYHEMNAHADFYTAWQSGRILPVFGALGFERAITGIRFMFGASAEQGVFFMTSRV